MCVNNNSRDSNLRASLYTGCIIARYFHESEQHSRSYTFVIHDACELTRYPTSGQFAETMPIARLQKQLVRVQSSSHFRHDKQKHLYLAKVVNGESWSTPKNSFHIFLDSLSCEFHFMKEKSYKSHPQNEKPSKWNTEKGISYSYSLKRFTIVILFDIYVSNRNNF